MKFKTVQEAFNYYRNFTIEALEKRAQEVSGIINTDPNIDITSLNIELTGIKQAKENAQEKQGEDGGQQEQRGALNIITGMNTGARKSFNAENVLESAEYRSAFYNGAQGTDLACLLRRLKRRLGIYDRSRARRLRSSYQDCRAARGRFQRQRRQPGHSAHFYP